MFRTIWSKSLRDYRVPILGWGFGLALLMVAGLAAATPALRDAYASIAQSLRFIGDPFAMPPKAMPPHATWNSSFRFY